MPAELDPNLYTIRSYEFANVLFEATTDDDDHIIGEWVFLYNITLILCSPFWLVIAATRDSRSFRHGLSKRMAMELIISKVDRLLDSFLWMENQVCAAISDKSIRVCGILILRLIRARRNPHWKRQSMEMDYRAVIWDWLLAVSLKTCNLIYPIHC